MTPSEILAIKEQVRARDGYRCSQCGMSRDEHYAIYGKDLEVHRVIPGGVYSLDGCLTACKPSLTSAPPPPS